MSAERPLKIGVVCHHTLGGSGIVAAEVGLALARRGHSLHFVGAERPARLDPQAANVAFHRVGAVEYPLFDHKLYTLPLASKLAEVAEEEGLDVLHVHYAIPHAISAVLAKQALGERAPKVITTLHGTDVTVVGGSPAFRPMTRLALEQSDHLTAPSRYLKEAAYGLGVSRERSFEVIPNFVDTDRFRPPEAEWELRSEPVLIHVSNFRPLKRITDVIDIFHRVRQALPGARLYLVGDGPERAVAEQRVRELGLAARVRFFGMRDAVDALLRQSDLFLLPSQSESFGLAALEAMSTGVPVVGSSVGGVPEVVADGVTGLLAPVGDVEAMARHAVDLLSDKDRHRRFSRAARERAAREFPLAATVDRYEACYRRVTSSSAQTTRR